MFGATGKIVQSVAEASDPDVRIVTQGFDSSDSNLVGFQTTAFNSWWGNGGGAFGSLNDNTWNSETIIGLSPWLTAGFGGGDEVYVGFDAVTLGAAWFTSIILLGAGEITLDTADATYDGTSGPTSDWSVWYWGVGETINVPASWDGSGAVSVEFVL